MLELDYLTKPIELAELTQALDQHWLAAGGSPADEDILVVDDDPTRWTCTPGSCSRIRPPHRVLKARNGREALEILQRETVDLVLLDLMMPELDGFGVLEAMRDATPPRATSR